MVLDGTGSVYDDTGWYLVSISWNCLVLGGTGSAKGLYAFIYWKKWRFGQVTPMPDRQTTKYRTTQLFYSIKFKLIGQVQTSLQCNSISGVGSFHLYASQSVKVVSIRTLGRFATTAPSRIKMPLRSPSQYLRRLGR